MKIVRNLMASLFLGLTLTSLAPADTEFVPPSEYAKYATVRLTADLSHLSAEEKQAVKEMIEAAKIMDGLFWRQAYGSPEALDSLIEDPETRRYARINYGPWDRLNGNKSFVKGFGPKPLGARFYPHDITKEEFEAADFPGKVDLYSVVRRD